MNKVNMMDFYDAYMFVEMHPAFIGGRLHGTTCFDIMVMPCCKNGVPEYGPVYVYPEDPRFEEFTDKGHQTDEVDGEVVCIWVTYKDYYGYSWEREHIGFTFIGGPNRYVELNEGDWQWQRQGDSDLDSRGKSYEEAVINLAEKVKQKYGDYSHNECDENTIIPSWIVKNNKIHRPFGENIKEMFKDGQLNRNPQNVHLFPEQINEMWWQLGLTNDHLKSYNKVDVSQFLKGDLS
jgi:hypothetical protein